MNGLDREYVSLEDNSSKIISESPILSSLFNGKIKKNNDISKKGKKIKENATKTTSFKKSSQKESKKKIQIKKKSNNISLKGYINKTNIKSSQAFKPTGSSVANIINSSIENKSLKEKNIITNLLNIINNIL